MLFISKLSWLRILWHLRRQVSTKPREEQIRLGDGMKDASLGDFIQGVLCRREREEGCVRIVATWIGWPVIDIAGSDAIVERSRPVRCALANEQRGQSSKD